MDTALRRVALLQMIPEAPDRKSTTWLHQELQKKGFTITARSVQRDLEDLSRTWPLLAVRSGRLFLWSFREKAAMFQIPAMAPSTALALKLAEDYLRPIMPPATLDLLEHYFQRAEEVLGKTQLGKWRSKVRIIRRGPELIPPDIREGIQEAVYEALLSGHQLDALYKGRGKNRPAQVTLNPLGIVARDGVIYLVATAWNYPDVRHFALHRMKRASVTESIAVTPEGFSFARHVDEDKEFSYPHSRRRLKLKILVNKYVAYHLEECRLSRDQRIKAAGTDRWRVEATVADTDELRWWLLGFGGGIRVLAPKALQRELNEWRTAAL